MAFWAEHHLMLLVWQLVMLQCQLVQKYDAVLFGAVGGPKGDDVDYEHRPEDDLLRLRKELDLFDNIRPAICFSSLSDFFIIKKRNR
jgi:Isocitrate/isopropylmalate dehydrogenase